MFVNTLKTHEVVFPACLVPLTVSPQMQLPYFVGRNREFIPTTQGNKQMGNLQCLLGIVSEMSIKKI